MSRKKLIGMFLLAIITASANQAQAEGWGVWGMDWGYSAWNSPAFGWNSWVYTPDYVGVPPYYAVRPPVYYNGKITRRSYGDSPFPYSAERPEPAAPQEVDSGFKPQMIHNPYLNSNADDKQGHITKPATSKVVINPYR